MLLPHESFHIQPSKPKDNFWYNELSINSYYFYGFPPPLKTIFNHLTRIILYPQQCIAFTSRFLLSHLQHSWTNQVFLWPSSNFKPKTHIDHLTPLHSSELFKAHLGFQAHHSFPTLISDDQALKGDLLYSSSSESLNSDGGGGSQIHHRYYHVFREGELDYLIRTYVDNLHIIR